MSKIKTAIILAAGKSTRFGKDKLSEVINGFTLPQRCITFCKMNGIEEIFVTLNKDNISMFGNELCHPIMHNIKSIANSVGYEKNAIQFNFQDKDEYGPGAAIKVWSKIERDCIVLFGDNLYIGELPEFNFSKYDVYTSYKDLPANPRNLQLAVIKDDYVIEKPHGEIKGRFFCGYVAFSSKVFDVINKIRKSSRNEYEITDLINFMNNRCFIKNDLIWADITYEADLQTIYDMLNEYYDTTRKFR